MYLCLWRTCGFSVDGSYQLCHLANAIRSGPLHHVNFCIINEFDPLLLYIFSIQFLRLLLFNTTNEFTYSYALNYYSLSVSFFLSPSLALFLYCLHNRQDCDIVHL